MQVFRGTPRRASQPSVLTIGNFDGVHRGHQALLNRLVAKARALDAQPTVLTFEPHPREYFDPSGAPPRLASLREKLLLLAEYGVVRTHVCHFSRRFATIDAESFIRTFLIDGLDVRHLIVGDDFRFGARRQGDFDMLLREGRRHGFSVETMPTLTLHGERVSSSAVRSALAAGQLQYAAELLGRPYSMSGRVVRGKQLGRTLGFPTANIRIKHPRSPLTGVFVVRVEGLGPAPVAGVANVGSRPTVSGGEAPNLEVHLLGWTGECYGEHLRVHFLEKQRDEVRYESLEALARQITLDADQARDWFARNPIQD